MNIFLTSKAIERVKALIANEKDAKDKSLRVYVEGGGCSGFQYGFMFDQAQDGDHVVHMGPISVVVDPFSAPYIKSSTVDYQESLMNTGFVVQNPNSKSTCGCGLSFSV